MTHEEAVKIALRPPPRAVRCIVCKSPWVYTTYQCFNCATHNLWWVDPRYGPFQFPEI